MKPEIHAITGPAQVVSDNPIEYLHIAPRPGPKPGCGTGTRMEDLHGCLFGGKSPQIIPGAMPHESHLAVTCLHIERNTLMYIDSPRVHGGICPCGIHGPQNVSVFLINNGHGACLTAQIHQVVGAQPRMPNRPIGHLVLVLSGLFGLLAGSNRVRTRFDSSFWMDKTCWFNPDFPAPHHHKPGLGLGLNK